MDTVLSICIGVGLAAACGFRIFVPLLIMSIASFSGHLTLAPSFAWIGTQPALITLAIATALEIVAYYVPWLDNFLDSIATPSAIVAGTIVTASMVTGVDPYFKWMLAVIAGGGAAGLVQSATVATRAVSTAVTGGLTNFVVSTSELFMSALTAILSVLWVPLALVFLGMVGVTGITVGLQVRKRLARPSV
jgi:hypothetical protein